MTFKNQEIRTKAKEKGVNLWEIAREMKMQDSNFSRLLREELSSEQKQKIIKIIDELAKERE